MWLITTNDRKLVPAVHRASGIADDRLEAPAAGIYGACIFASEIEVLSLKRRIAKGTSLPELIAPQLRSNRVLATLDTTPGKIFRPENTQPFRHKGWVFALSTDDVPALPEPEDSYEREFLARNVRGTSELERIANLIMCRVVRTAAGRSRHPEPALMRDAVAGVLDPLEGLNDWAAILTSATTGIVTSRGVGVHYRSVKGQGEAGGRRKPGIVYGSSHVRATVVTCGDAHESKGWKTVDDGATLVVDDLPPARVL